MANFRGLRGGRWAIGALKAPELGYPFVPGHRRSGCPTSSWQRGQNCSCLLPACFSSWPAIVLGFRAKILVPIQQPQAQSSQAPRGFQQGLSRGPWTSWACSTQRASHPLRTQSPLVSVLMTETMGDKGKLHRRETIWLLCWILGYFPGVSGTLI